jgi:hypothetical protein
MQIFQSLFRSLKRWYNKCRRLFFSHWSKLIDVSPDLVIVISYNGVGFSRPELTLVNIGNNKIDITTELINQIARKHFHDENNNQEAFTAVINARLFQAGSFNDKLPHPWVFQSKAASTQDKPQEEPIQKNSSSNSVGHH